MPEEDNNKGSVNEPGMDYKDDTIRIFQSAEEAELYNLRTVKNQSPVNRVKDTVKLILRVYSKSLQENKISDDQEIIIDKE